jgi:acyl transferase domain-containing protein
MLWQVQRLAIWTMLLVAATVVCARSAHAQEAKKDYLTDAEGDRIRDAVTPPERMKLFVIFADDRLKKFQYELTRTVPEGRRAEILNGLLNAYAGCIDDAADQIEVAREKQVDIRAALKNMQSKGKEFLEALQKINQGGPEYDIYKETLQDAIEGTQDALADVDKALKELNTAPVRRKPS